MARQRNQDASDQPQRREDKARYGKQDPISKGRKAHDPVARDELAGSRQRRPIDPESGLDDFHEGRKDISAR